MAENDCFVIMPFGDKPDVGGDQLDFDQVYEQLIKPAVEVAKLECIRCDEIGTPGWIHAEMISHLYSADVAIVDVTALNANVFYELGVRHALRRSVTVLIRRKGTEIPFNIQGLNVIEYDMEGIESINRARVKISEFISAGVHGRKSDSLVHDVLDLRIGNAPPKVATKTQRSYRLKRVPRKRVCIITGDIKRITGIDVWVNSENTNMQMARFYDRSVSSVIRYLGAEKDEFKDVTKDSVADELAKKVGSQKIVRPATVVVTTSGELAKTHGVKRIFHVAAVIGAVGHGYVPISNIPDCVGNALEVADSEECRDDPPRSILFPLMGTGTARGDLQAIVAELLGAAIDYLVDNPKSTIERVCFVAWSEQELRACEAFLDGCAAVVRAAGRKPREG